MPRAPDAVRALDGRLAAIAFAAQAAFFHGAVHAQATPQPVTVSIVPSADATVFSEDPDGANGAADNFYFGTLKTGDVRRALLRFDVAGRIPAGATVRSVELRFEVNRSQIGTAVPASLHRVLAAWTEGPANPGFGGVPAPAGPGDVTWTRRSHPATAWTSAGVDFAPPSAVQGIGGAGPRSFVSTPGLVADVQGWLDAPATNHGWLLRGDEGTVQSVRRTYSREAAQPGQRPTLQVTYDPPLAGSGTGGGVADVPLPPWAWGLLAAGLAAVGGRRRPPR